VVILTTFRHQHQDNQTVDHVFKDVYGVLLTLSILAINAMLEIIEMKDKEYALHVQQAATLALLVTLVQLVVLATI